MAEVKLFTTLSFSQPTLHGGWRQLEARSESIRRTAHGHQGGGLGGTTVGRWMAFPPASTCSGNAAYYVLR